MDGNLLGTDIPGAGGKGSSAVSDPETEKALLSLCIRRKESVNDTVSRKIVKEDFSDRRNSLIFEAIANLYINNGKIDKFNISDELERMGQSSAAGGSEYLFEVANTQSVASNIDSYITIIREKSQRRQLIKSLDEMKKLAQSGKNAVNDVVDIVVGRLTGMREAPEGIGFEQLSAILRRNLNDIHRIRKGELSATGIRSGFRKLDNMIGGFRPGTLNIIAARPGMGKTALVINIATNVGVHKHQNVNIFSLEMSKEEIGNRIMASRADVTTKKLQRATGISEEEETKLARVYSDLAELPIYIDDNSSVNPISMLSTCKELKANGKLGLLIVDYLQLMSMPGRGNNSSRQQEISDISRSLKVMAKDLGVPIIALSQLSRGSERREDHTPMLSDLRDSGAIEQDADCVIFIDREDYYNKDIDKISNPIQNAKLIVAKNRHGETGTVPVKWWGEKTLFFEEDAAYDPKDPRATGQQSSYTRTVSGDSSAASYSFDDKQDQPAPPGADDMIPPPPPAGADDGYPYAEPSYGGDASYGADPSYGGDPSYSPDASYGAAPSYEEPPFEPDDMSNPDNDVFFADSNTDFPEGF